MRARDAAIREELERILASGAFAASPMLASFLRYVVEETLAGRADRLKAYTIAVGALSRSENFDPNENPLVRVQARRLRQALGRHYETVETFSGLRIDLPLGSYVPIFVEVDAVCDESAEGGLAARASRSEDDGGETIGEAPDESFDETLRLFPVEPRPGPPRRRLPRRAVLATMLVIGVLLGAAGVRWIPALSPTAPSAPVTDRVAAPPNPANTAERRNLDASRVLPLLYVDVEVRDPAAVGFDAEIYRNRVESFAQKFDDTIVITRRSPDFPAPDGQPLYLLRFLIAREGSSINAYYRLVHAGDDRVLKAGVVALRSPLGGTAAGPDEETPSDLALVRDIVQLHGVITLDLANLDDLSPELGCLAHAWQFYRELTEAAHVAARTCLEKVVADDPRLTPALTLLGGLYIGEFRQSIDAMPGDPLARAEELIGRAVRIAPTSSTPYQMLQSLLLTKGDVTAAELSGRRAVELSPADLNAVGAYGSLLARVGRYEEALALLRRTAEEMQSPPKWIDYYTFLALNNLGRTEEADRQVALFDGTRSTLFLTAVAIRAHRRRDDAAAAAAFAEIVRAEPDFGTDPRAFLRRRGLADRVIDRLMIDLEPAGLPVPPR